MQWNLLRTLVIRDGLLMIATAALWVCTLGIGQTGGWPLTVSIFTGLMSVLIGYLLHEWGHLIGAWVGGSVVHLPESATASAFLFRFDTGRNNRHQFLVMSAGGFIASGLVVAALIILLPLEMLASRVALGLTVLGVVATFVLEIPPALKVWRGGAMPEGVAFVASSDVTPH